MKHLLLLAVAALLAFAGVAYAAGSITGKSIKDNTITGKDVKNKSLTAKDFKGSVRGPRGFTGPAGPAGAQGPAGPSAVGQLTIVRSPEVPYGSDVVVGAQALCPAGQRVVSGGGGTVSTEQLAATEPTDGRTGWFVVGINTVEYPIASIQAVALCAPADQAVAASNARAKAEAQVRRRVEAIAAVVRRR